MSITYYPYAWGYSFNNIAADGGPFHLTNIAGPEEVVVDSVKSYKRTFSSGVTSVGTVTGDIAAWETALRETGTAGIWELEPPDGWLTNLGVVVDGHENTAVLFKVTRDDFQSGLTDVTGLGDESYINGRYRSNYHTPTVFTPVKEGFRFEPESVSLNKSNGGGAWVEFLAFPVVAGPSTPTLTSPTDGSEDHGLNTDWLKEMIYDDVDGESLSSYTVHFSIDGGSNFIPQNDRSRYSIITYKMFLGITLDYGTTYYWFVRKDVEDEITDSDVWSFSTLAFLPPWPSRHPVTDLLTGDNGMVTVRRLVAAANNKIFYES